MTIPFCGTWAKGRTLVRQYQMDYFYPTQNRRALEEGMNVSLIVLSRIKQIYRKNLVGKWWDWFPCSKNTNAEVPVTINFLEIYLLASVQTNCEQPFPPLGLLPPSLPFCQLSLPANPGPFQKKIKMFDSVSFFPPSKIKKTFIKSHGGGKMHSCDYFIE